MSQQAQANGLHERGVRLFEEARRGLDDALGRMSTASEKLRDGDLTPEAKAVWREKFDAAHTEATELKTRAKRLNLLSDGLGDFERSADQPAYLHPNDVGAEGDQPTGDPDDQATRLAGTRRVGARDGEDSPDFGMQLGAGDRGPTSPQQRIMLNRRARVLLNRIMRGEQFNGGCRYRDLSKRDQDFLSRQRPEMLMSPYVERDGGMITAEEVRNEVIGHLRDALYIRSRARTISTTASSVSFPTAKIALKLKKTRAGRGTGEAPTVLRKVFGKTHFVPSGSSETVLVPEELIDDQTFDVVAFISEQIALNDQETEEEGFINGSGNGEPLGILPALQRLEAAGFGGLGFDHSGSGANFSARDLKRFPYKLRKIFRAGGGIRGAAWTANKTWLENVSIMRTEAGGAGTDTGDFLFRQGTETGDPDSVVGFPFLESEFFPDNVTTGNTGDPLALFGNWSYYWIVDRKSLEIRVLAELYSKTDEVGYKYTKRYDGAPVRAEAFVYMKRTA